MTAHLPVLVCLLAHSLYITAAEPDNNATMTAVPLSEMQSSGMLSAMKSGRDFASFLFKDYDRASRPRNHAPVKDIDYRGNTLVGSEPIASVERSEVAAMLDHAGCNPYDQVVELANSKPNVIMYPSCVLAKRCGGCCGHPALKCSASAVNNKLVSVAKYVYDGSSMWPEEVIDYVTVEEHTACECTCKVQESDCNPALHIFDQQNCQCKCINNALSGSCPINKRWNPDICACQCATTVNCGTGYTYNMNTCLCEEVTERGNELPGPTIADNGGSTDQTAPVDEASACGHLNCPRRYKATLVSGGACTCRPDRNWRHG